MSSLQALAGLRRDEHGLQEFNRHVFGTPLHPGQLRVSLGATKFANLISPGNSFGKTELIARDAVWSNWFKECDDLDFTGDPLGWLRADYRSLVASYQFDIAKESWLRLLQEYERGGLFSQMVRRVIRSDPPLIEFANGSILNWGSLDGGGRGVEATRRRKIWVDEVGHMSDFKSIWGNVLRPRMLGVGGKAWLLGTPKPHSDPWLFEVKQDAEDNPDGPYYFAEGSSFENPYWSERDRQMVLDDPLLYDKNAQRFTELGEQVVNGKFISAGELFFKRVAVLRMFRGEHTWQPATKGWCVTGWDLGGSKRGGDATVGVTLDISRDPWRVTRLEHIPAGDADWEDKYRIIQEAYEEDQPLTVGVDVTGATGDSISEELSRRGVHVTPIHFGGLTSKKYDMLRNLQQLTEQQHQFGKGRIVFPDDRTHPELVERRKEFDRYRLEDKKLTTDTVMALAIAGKLAVENSLPPAVTGVVF